MNAHGVSTLHDDQIEAQAIHTVLNRVPVTAPKSYFGYLGAGGGCVELIASLGALCHNEVPVTLNYRSPDPRCPVQVVHGEPLRNAPPCALVLNHSATGQAAAVILTQD